MDAILKQLLAGATPYLLDYFLDNKHILIDFLREQAKKTDNKIDDAIVDVISHWLDTL